MLVLDEYGSVVGMVTPEDMLHAIAGHMGNTITNDEGFLQADGSWNLSGRLSIDALNQLIGEIPKSEAATLAGLILEQCGRIPATGEHGTWPQWRWEILQMDAKRIARVRLTPLSTPS